MKPDYRITEKDRINNSETYQLFSRWGLPDTPNPGHVLILTGDVTQLEDAGSDLFGFIIQYGIQVRIEFPRIHIFFDADCAVPEEQLEMILGICQNYGLKAMIPQHEGIIVFNDCSRDLAKDFVKICEVCNEHSLTVIMSSKYELLILGDVTQLYKASIPIAEICIERHQSAHWMNRCGNLEWLSSYIEDNELEGIKVA